VIDEMFNIEFVTSNRETGVVFDPVTESVGEIAIGGFTERFVSSGTFWSQEDYVRQERR
jgi:hypothetical protein